MRVRASVLLPATALAAVGLFALPGPSRSDEALAPSQVVLAAADLEPAVRSVTAERPVARAHRVAVLHEAVAAASRPGGRRTIRLEPTTDFGSRQTLAVAARRGDWLGLVTSVRPNNKLAWVRRGHRSLRMRRTRYSLHADLSARRLSLRKGGRLVRRLAVAIGRPGATTPTGRFAVTDKLSGSRFGPYYGCCVLALNGHQPNRPPGWPGGNRLAIHGTDSPSTIGAAASAGCLRAADADLRVLMANVPLGTPVFIHG